MNDGPDGIAERIRWRYYQGAVLLGVGSGAMLLGKHGHSRKTGPPLTEKDDSALEVAAGSEGGGEGGAVSTYKSFDIVPAMIGVDEDLMRDVVEHLGYGSLGFVLPIIVFAAGGAAGYDQAFWEFLGCFRNVPMTSCEAEVPKAFLMRWRNAHSSNAQISAGCFVLYYAFNAAGSLRALLVRFGCPPGHP